MKTKKLLAFVLAAIMIFAAAPIASASPSTTTVDGNTFYEIRTADDLLWFANQVENGEMGINAILVNDISLAGIKWTPIATYSGIFDGGNHTISALDCCDAALDFAGLFAYIKEGAVRNLTVSGKVASKDMAGIIAAVIFDSIIYNCTAIGEVSRLSQSYKDRTCYIGGLVGYSYHSVILNCGAQVNITVDFDSTEISDAGVGGLVGLAAAESPVCILNSYCNGNITVSGNTYYTEGSDFYVGGIAGYLEDDAVNNYFIGEITDTDGINSKKHIGYAFGCITPEIVVQEEPAVVSDEIIVKNNFYPQGKTAVAAADSEQGTIDPSWTQAVSDSTVLLDLLNANLPEVESIIVEHRDFLYDSAWADLVEYINGESVSAAKWEMGEGGFPVPVTEEEIPEEPEIPECDHMCHDGGFLWNIIKFFQKLFGIEKYCGCGAAHY